MISIAPSNFVIVAPIVLLIWAISFARQIVKGKMRVGAWLSLMATLAICYWLFN